MILEVKVLRGEPGPAIVDYANEEEFDLAILGSRGLNRLQEMVLGSVSQKVVKRVNCPVLIENKKRGIEENLRFLFLRHS